MIHFDATDGRVEDLIEHKSAIREHVSRGGYLGWGLWPTDGPQPDPFDPKAKQYFLANAARDLSFVDASVGLIQNILGQTQHVVEFKRPDRLRGQVSYIGNRRVRGEDHLPVLFRCGVENSGETG